MYHFHPGMLRHWHGLAELTWTLPDWVWQHGGAEHALAASIPGPALTIGAHLSMSTVFQDLDFLRRYGNSGAHADRDFNVGNVSPDAEIVCSVLRVSLSFRRCTCVFARVCSIDTHAAGLVLRSACGLECLLDRVASSRGVV